MSKHTSKTIVEIQNEKILDKVRVIIMRNTKGNPEMRKKLLEELFLVK